MLPPLCCATSMSMPPPSFLSRPSDSTDHGLSRCADSLVTHITKVHTSTYLPPTHCAELRTKKAPFIFKYSERHWHLIGKSFSLPGKEAVWRSKEDSLKPQETSFAILCWTVPMVGWVHREMLLLSITYTTIKAGGLHECKDTSQQDCKH